MIWPGGVEIEREVKEKGEEDADESIIFFGPVYS